MNTPHTNFSKEIFARSYTTIFTCSFEITLEYVITTRGARLLDHITDEATMLIVGEFPAAADLQFAARHSIFVIPEAVFLCYMDDDIDPRTNPSLVASQPIPEPLPPPRNRPPEPRVAKKLTSTYYDNPFAHLKSAALMVVACAILAIFLHVDPIDILLFRGGIPGLLGNLLQLCIIFAPFCIWALAHHIRSGDDPK